MKLDWVVRCYSVTAIIITVTGKHRVLFGVEVVADVTTTWKSSIVFN